MPKEEILPVQVPFQCAHRDTVMYPLANIETQLGGMAFMVKPAMSDRLPMSILLATVVPQLVELLNSVGEESA